MYARFDRAPAVVRGGLVVLLLLIAAFALHTPSAVAAHRTDFAPDPDTSRDGDGSSPPTADPGGAPAAHPGGGPPTGVGATPHFASGLDWEWCGTETAADFRPGWFAQQRAQVKVVYAYATDQTGEFQQFSDLIQRDTKAALEFVGDASGGQRSIAFDLGTECGPRYVDIASVPLNSSSSHYTDMPTVHDRTSAVQREVREKLGLGANDRPGSGGTRNFAVYLNIGTIPRDWTAARGDLPGCPRGGHCQPDDRPGPENIANSGGYWAWVVQDLHLLVGRHAMLHEITHNLGAVQRSAPHSSGDGHCTDGNGRDVMCPPPGARPEAPPCYDCGGDDYFNVNPSQENHLATHWNVANSVFTCGYYASSPAGADGCAPTPIPDPQSVVLEPDPKPCRSKHHNPPELCGPR
jgi:hypothetical protein